MVGTIYGLGLSQQFDENGDPHSGCKLYLYEAGTSTPVTTYKDFGLTSGQEHQHPIVADAAGRIPAFWVADGSYRVRLTTSAGTEIFDESTITAIGASSGTASGGGVSTEVTFATGDMICTFDEGTRSGWVRMWGTIGPASSAATNRANADTESLFAFLWNNVSDTYAPVTGGRGASAAADFAAAKVIQIPDMQGRCFIGLDDMQGGSPAADVVAAALETGYAAGTEDVTLTSSYLIEHEHGPGTLTVANHGHSVGTLAIADHTHSDTLTYDYASSSVGVSTGSDDLCLTSDTYITTACGGAVTSQSLSITGASADAGPAVDAGVTATAGTADPVLPLMNPYRAGSWYIKL